MSYYVNISIADRYPELGEPIVITTTTTKPFSTVMSLWESDTHHFADGRIRTEGKGKATFLARYKVAGQGKKFSQVELVKMAHKPMPRGFFHDSWDEFRFFQKEGEKKVFAHRCAEKRCHVETASYDVARTKAVWCKYGAHMSGRIVQIDGKESLRLKWKNAGDKGVCLLTLVDNQTLSGYWYSTRGTTSRKARDRARRRAKDDPGHVLYLRRGRSYSKEAPGITIPIAFDGLEQVHQLWISEDELVREFWTDEDFSRQTADSFLLEVGLRYRKTAYHSAGNIDKANTRTVYSYHKHYAEYKVPFDPKDKEALIQFVVANRAWTAGARLGPANKENVGDEELRQLGATLCPGKPEWWKEAAFVDAYAKALERGENDRKTVRESLFTRFALGGFKPGTGVNKFAGGDRMLAYEFEEYCKPEYHHFPEHDVFVEVCQHPPGESFPGRRWHLVKRDNTSYYGRFGSLAMGLVVPKGCKVRVRYRRRRYREKTMIKWLGPGTHRLRKKKGRMVASIRVYWDENTGPSVRPADYRLAAYRRGRQLARIAEEGALGASEHAPDDLLHKSEVVGLANKDVKALFAKSYKAARFDRECLLVKILFQFGHDEKSENPFSESRRQREHEEFKKFKKLASNSAYAGAVREGRALWEIRKYAIRCGRVDCRAAIDARSRKKYGPEALKKQKPLKQKMRTIAPREFIQRQAVCAHVSVELAKKIFKEAWKSGWESMHHAIIGGFLSGARAGTQELLAAALQKYVAWLLYKKDKSGYIFEIQEWVDFANFPKTEDVAKVRDRRAYTYKADEDDTSSDLDWEDFGVPYQHLHNHQATDAFLALRQAAARNAIPERYLDVLIREALHEGGAELAYKATSWMPTVKAIGIRVYEIFTLVVLSSGDAIGSPIAYFFDFKHKEESEQWLWSVRFIESQKTWTELSMFHEIPPEGSLWGLWRFAAFELGDAVFKVGMAVTGIGLLAGAVGAVRAGFAGFVRSMVRGGIQFLASGGLRTLGQAFALGTLTGITQEVLEARFKGEDATVLGAIGKSLTNTAMACVFMAIGAGIGKGKLATVFKLAAFMPAGMGLVSTSLRMADALTTGDKEEWKLFMFEAQMLIADFVVTAGGLAIGKCLARKYVALKNSKLAPDALDRKLGNVDNMKGTETPHYTPEYKPKKRWRSRKQLESNKHKDDGYLTVDEHTWVDTGNGGKVWIEKAPSASGVKASEVRCGLWRAFRKKCHVEVRQPFADTHSPKARWGKTSDLIEYRDSLPVTVDVYSPTKGATPGQLATLKRGVSPEFRQKLSQKKAGIDARIKVLRAKKKTNAEKTLFKELESERKGIIRDLRDLKEPKFREKIKFKLSKQAVEVIVDLCDLPPAQQKTTVDYLKTWLGQSERTGLRVEVIRTNGGPIPQFELVHSPQAYSKVRKHVRHLRNRGHGVQRHGAKVTRKQLQDRLVHGHDPMTGTTKDAVHGGEHRVGEHASKFTSDDGYVKAEKWIRRNKRFKKAIKRADKKGDGFTIVQTKLKRVFGENYKDSVEGFSKSPHPPGFTKTDFTDGTVTAIYQKVGQRWVFYTMYAGPKN